MTTAADLPTSKDGYGPYTSNLHKQHSKLTHNPLSPKSPLGASWCQIKDSTFELLFDTRGGAPIPLSTLMYAIGIVREALAELIAEQGEHAHYNNIFLSISSKGVVVTMFDERMPLYTLRELHDAVDVVLLCSYQNNVRQEVHGTIFSVPE
ncbi:MAG: hypothetical protein Q9183_006193, partial [Haloplaca sp. 2 TL-2023]